MTDVLDFLIAHEHVLQPYGFVVVLCIVYAIVLAWPSRE